MRKLLLLLLGAILVVGGCGGDGDEGDETVASGVTVELIAFKPDRVDIKRGESVTWTQKDATVHTVTSGAVTQDGGIVSDAADGKFDSDQLAQDKTFTFTFDEMGTFTYFCRIHPATMQGVVQVS